jgi:hypothetical protein
LTLAVVDEQLVPVMPAASHQVRPAIAVHIARRRAEAGQFHRQADPLADVLELQPAQIAIQPRAALTALEKAFADEQIEQPVAIVVGRRHAAGGESLGASRRFRGNIGELAAPFVAKQMIRLRIVWLRRAAIDRVIGRIEVQIGVVI